MYKSQSNTIDALGFYRNEMHAYSEYGKLSDVLPRGDKFTIWLGRTFSDFGQSWSLPLKWMIGSHLVLFGILWATGYNDHYYSIEDHSWWSVLEGLGECASLLNPVHRMPDGMVGGREVIDLIMRVFSGFFIYHIIRASRKFARI